MEHFLVARKKRHYLSFPSIIAHLCGSFYLAYRSAPTKRSKTHIDTRSVAVVEFSKDGRNWSEVGQFKCRNDYTGVQDPVIGSAPRDNLALTYFAWKSLRDSHTKKRKHVKMAGAFLSRSHDFGKTWMTPEPVSKTYGFQSASRQSVFYQNESGYLFCGYADMGGDESCCFILTCVDEKSEMVKVAQNYTEPFLLMLGNGHWLILLRSQTGEIHQAHSWDGGKHWEPTRSTGIIGVPPHLCQLDDGHILCTYGYRQKPFGVRACLSYDDGLTWDVKNEIILRADGGGWDLGYPYTVQTKEGSLLTVYYFFTKRDKTRRIEGTLWMT